MTHTRPEADRFGEAVNLLKAMAHPVRLRILDLLRRDAECVCHLEAALDRPQPYVSQQLRVLREGGLIVAERRGPNVFYSLADARVRAVLDLLLGPPEEDPAMLWAKLTISCSCPKCESERAASTTA